MKIVLNFLLFIIVFSLSYYILPFYVNGDQYFYNEFYLASKELSLSDTLVAANFMISTLEPIYPTIIWIFSSFLDRIILMSFFNSFVALVYFKLAVLREGNKILSFFIVAFSYYFLVLFLSADRLKFSFLFLGLGLLYNKSIRNIFFYSAMLSHIQTLIVFTSLNIKKAKLFFRLSFLFYILIFCLVIFFLSEHILNKLPAYLFKNFDIFGLMKILFFYLLSVKYKKEEKNIFIYFVPIFFFTLLFGGDRIVIYAYFVFMYFGLNYKNGLNFGVILVNLFFFYKSIIFLYNIVIFGSGF